MDLFLYINVFVPAIVSVFSRPSDSAAIAKASREADSSTPLFRLMDGRNESIPIAESNDLKIHEELNKMDEELNKMDEDVNKMDEEVDEMADKAVEMDKGADKIDEDKMNQRQLANSSVTIELIPKIKKLVKDLKQDKQLLEQEKEQLNSYIQAKHKEYSVMSAFYQEREQERANSAKSNPDYTPKKEDWEDVMEAVEVIDKKMRNQGTLKRTNDCSQFNFDAFNPNVECSPCHIPKVRRDEESGCDKWECANPNPQCTLVENIPIKICESECDHVKVEMECGCNKYSCAPLPPPMQQCSADTICGKCEQCVEKPWISQKCSEKTGFTEHVCERKNCTELPGMPICLDGEKKRQNCNHCECMSGFWACKKAPCIVKPRKMPEKCPPGMRGTHKPYCRPAVTKIPEKCPPGMRGTQPYCRPAVPKPNILTTGICATSPQLPCCKHTAIVHKMFNAPFRVVNLSYPTCRPNGYYAAKQCKQCNWATCYCYCVKPNGESADATPRRDATPGDMRNRNIVCQDGDDQPINHHFAELEDPEVEYEDPATLLTSEDPETLLTSEEIRNLPTLVPEYDDETHGKTIDELMAMAMGNSADVRMPEIEFKGKEMGKQ